MVAAAPNSGFRQRRVKEVARGRGQQPRRRRRPVDIGFVPPSWRGEGRGEGRGGNALQVPPPRLVLLPLLPPKGAQVVQPQRVDERFVGRDAASAPVGGRRRRRPRRFCCCGAGISAGIIDGVGVLHGDDKSALGFSLDRWVQSIKKKAAAVAKHVWREENPKITTLGASTCTRTLYAGARTPATRLR